MNTMIKTLTAAAALALLAACTTTSPDVVQRGDAQRLATVQDATVLSVRSVVVDGTRAAPAASPARWSAAWPARRARRAASRP